MACSDGDGFGDGFSSVSGLLEIDPSMRETGEIKLDLETMQFIQRRLDLVAFGLLSVQIARAAAAKRPSELQRILLAIVRHREDGEDRRSVEPDDEPAVGCVGGVDA
jgi:hypothetical protein